LGVPPFQQTSIWWEATATVRSFKVLVEVIERSELVIQPWKNGGIAGITNKHFVIFHKEIKKIAIPIEGLGYVTVGIC